MSYRRQPQALSVAVDLLRMPSKVRAMRSAPLPSGILLLLRLAAEEAEAQSEAGKLDKRAPDAHREAAIFFIEQILLASNSNAYRVLGLDETATSTEMRRHMAYLLKWLHPDRNQDPHKALLARRVILAWNELKFSQRRPRDGAKRGDGQRRPYDFHRLRPASAIEALQRGYAGSSRSQVAGGMVLQLKRRMKLRSWPL
jgi:hypothetical protein